MNQLIFLLAKQWVEIFLVRPLATTILTLAIVASGAAIIVYTEEFDRKKQELKRLENNTYDKQLKQLNETEKNIHQLLEFVKTQQLALRDTEDAITKLKSEKEKLQPLIELDKAAVEAIFLAQEERASASIWRERTIGFAIGLVASLIASFIWYIALILTNKIKSQPLPNDTSK
ncbi:hypothetical protein [Pseudomonas sp. NFACC42-2]|uniref:hypothetical protein n=1 Tax=Pseudomonas sp. NFACC42-2 TaxID=1566193 RepID=UPI000B83EA15|nr:hypothetical protein [Pseudomonas sp. NFACC42-2]